MNRTTLIVTVGYGLWVVLCVLLTAFNIGDSGVASHLALIFTGPPASILSLYLPNGTLAGVIAAGLLGWTQWFVVVKFATRSSSHRGERSGA